MNMINIADGCFNCVINICSILQLNKLIFKKSNRQHSLNRELIYFEQFKFSLNGPAMVALLPLMILCARSFKGSICNLLLYL